MTFSTDRKVGLKLVCAIFCLLCISPAFSADLFNYNNAGAASGNLADDSEKTKFSAGLNQAALKANEIVVNLPWKKVSATRMMLSSDQPPSTDVFSFKEQSGSITTTSKNGLVSKVIIHDVTAGTVMVGQANGSGQIDFQMKEIESYICHEFVESAVVDNIPGVDYVSFEENPGSITLSEVTSLQSRPSASNVIYIDNLGGTVSGTQWNAAFNNGNSISYPPYSYDSNLSSFSAIDRHAMYSAWAEMAEDYAPFNVNVTTNVGVFNAASGSKRSRIIATGEQDWLVDDIGFTVGGIAYVDVFGEPTSFYTIGWTFNNGFSSTGMTHSHESGHQMGLSHDGVGSTTYYDGHNNWGPIMGGPFGMDFVQWSRGEYSGANQQENDLSIIRTKLGVLSDDYGNSNGSAGQIADNEVIGIIRPAGLGTDSDVFRISVAKPQIVKILVRALFEGNNDFDGGLNLSAKISLRSSSGALIAQKLPSSIPANNDFDFSQSLGAGTYYLKIENQSFNSNVNTGFSSYGNGGYYQIIYDSKFVTMAPIVQLLLGE